MAGGDTATGDTVAEVDWVRVSGAEPDDGVREPGDEFEGDALDGCRWDAVTRYDESEVAVADGELRMTTQPGDINGTDNGDPRNLVLQKAPEGDWVAETRMKAPLAHRWQLAGLLAYGDDDNYVKLDVVARNEPGARWTSARSSSPRRTPSSATVATVRWTSRTPRSPGTGTCAWRRSGTRTRAGSATAA
ncbi:hypothetical protein [Cellulosimicrobium sp. CUA-896]|uniref:beta-xylosidase family glycoside hydrolase n=1 Tax=Cellulosimicrobium sp. CUA-896 TaxID=1517881 RepID=UPI001651AE4D